MKWTPLVTDGIIFDYSQYMDVSSREIALPKNSFREFKVKIEDVTDDKESPFKELTRTFKAAKEDQRVERTVIERRPFRIDRIDSRGAVVREGVPQAKMVSYPVAGVDAKVDAAKKQTVVMVRSRREPITRFTLETTNRNSSRRARGRGPGGARTEHGLAAARGGDDRELQLPQAKARNVDDHDPGAARGAIPDRYSQRGQSAAERHRGQGGGERAAPGLSRPAGEDLSCPIWIGNRGAPPNYEAATVAPPETKARQHAEVLAKLGVEAGNAEFGGEPARAVRGWLDNWLFLGTAIGLMVVFLGWCLFRAGRRLESLPKE